MGHPKLPSERELHEKNTIMTNQATNTRGFDFIHKHETSGDETSSIANVLLFSEDMK